VRDKTGMGITLTIRILRASILGHAQPGELLPASGRRNAAPGRFLPAISDAIGALIAYFPRIIAAFLILLLGSIIAQVAGRTVRDTGRASGLEVANAMGNLTTGVIFFVLLVMALGQLEVDTSIVREFSTVLLAAAGLGLALSFGLGSRDITRNVLAGYYVRRAFPVGTEIEIHGHRGVVEAITPTQTLLREEGGTVVLPNAVFLDSTAGRPAN